MRMGSVAVSDSASRALRSLSASRTVSIKLCGPLGTSWSTTPNFMFLRILISPSSGLTSPFIRRNKVDLPVPFRPTKPTLSPWFMASVACSNRGRPSMRYVKSLMCNMHNASIAPLQQCKPALRARQIGYSLKGAYNGCSKNIFNHQA